MLHAQAIHVPSTYQWLSLAQQANMKFCFPHLSDLQVLGQQKE
ncbi:hypothetical protein W04_3368 [Pseudoalteromonas sp. SW0106-04]|nr:hypothetical protein W04_3368 [Pseudoalteromonas sp. SW0106-04]